MHVGRGFSKVLPSPQIPPYGSIPLQFLVDITCGDGRELYELSQTEPHIYSRFVGFCNTEPITYGTLPLGFDLFRGPVRLTECLHIPWVVYSSKDPQLALEVVEKHGHPQTRLHPLTKRLLMERYPPQMVKTTVSPPQFIYV